jgi:class 3 adenylate cyclase
LEDDKHKENQSHKRDVSYNTKSKSDNIQEEIDKNNNNNTHSNTDTYTNRNTISSIDNRIIYDLQTLLSQRQERLWSVLHERYQYNTSIKRAQDFLLNHVDSKLSLVVMYADLVGSTKMSMALPVEKMAKIIKAFSHELSSVVESYNGFVLKYVGDAVIAFFPSGFNKYLSCDTAFQCAKSMINVTENGINPILEKDKDNYPKLAVKIAIDEGENLVIQYGYDKSAPIDLIGYPMNVAAKMESLTGPNKISVGNNVYKLLLPTILSDFQEMQIKETEWKYIDLETNLRYKVYTTK